MQPARKRPRRSPFVGVLIGVLVVAASVVAGALVAFFSPSPHGYDVATQLNGNATWTGTQPARDAAVGREFDESGSVNTGAPDAVSAGAKAIAARALQAQVDELTEENERLAGELAEVAEELATRKSEVSFSYGTVQESGAFVGRTLRLRIEIANAPELQADEMRRLDNQLDILSLGPFIRDAEVLESDPVVFAQFQSALIGEMLQTDAARRAAIAHILQQRKAEALEQEEDDQAWLALNERTADEVVALFNEAERSALAQPLSFLREHGVLMIPAYSVLE